MMESANADSISIDSSTSLGMTTLVFETKTAFFSGSYRQAIAHILFLHFTYFNLA